MTPDDFYSPEVRETSADAKALLYDATKLSTIRQVYKTSAIVKFHGDFSNHMAENRKMLARVDFDF
ncbi:MAG: hypothetical protein EXQ52_10950 [Bryobacterales bacterium]|nr:hypothetical protein [Bryobacterales bacterium]